MKSVVARAVVVSVASASEAAPIAKVIQMVSDLETKIIGKGEANVRCLTQEMVKGVALEANEGR